MILGFVREPVVFTPKRGAGGVMMFNGYYVNGTKTVSYNTLYYDTKLVSLPGQVVNKKTFAHKEKKIPAIRN